MMYATDLSSGNRLFICIKGREYRYVLRENTIDFEIEIRPSIDEVSTIWKTYPKAETRTPPDENIGRYCELVRYDSGMNELQFASFGFTKSMDCCFIEIDGEIRYIASTNEYAIAEDILSTFPIMKN